MWIRDYERVDVKNVSLHNLWRYLAFSKPYWKLLIIGSIAGMLRFVTMLVLPHALGQSINLLTDTKNPLPIADRIPQLWPILSIFIWLLPMHYLATLGRLYVVGIATSGAIRDIRFQLFDKLQRLGLAFHTRRPTGTIVSRMMTDVATGQNAYDLMFVQLFQQLLLAVGAGIILFSTNWQWALVSLSTTPVYVLITRLMRRPFRQASLQTLESTSQISGFVFERLAMIREVQAFTAEDHEQDQLENNVEDLRKYSIRQSWFSSNLTACAEITRYTGQIICIVYGAYQIAHGGAKIGDLPMFYLYLGFLLDPINWLSTVQAQIHVSAAAADRVMDFFDKTIDIKDAPDAQRLAPHRPPEVRFEHVTFHYPTDAEEPVTVLNDVTFTAKPGMRVVLVGESGAGKSTLMNVLPRFYDLESGQVLIDGQSVSAVKVHSLRRAIAIVPQEPVLFTGTIWENILYGRRDAPEEDVRAAAKAANAEQFIEEFHDGYNTIVGERGVGLSGGQIQRISIARAFLKNPPILIMDEATSNLDALSEALVLEALDRVAAGRTTFVIAHRLSVARKADLIVVLGEGRILEQGTHQELLAKNGKYAELWHSQVAPVG